MIDATTCTAVIATTKSPIKAEGGGAEFARGPTFKADLDKLEARVSRLAADDPAGYKTHPKTKLPASVYHAITQLVPANPDAPEFKLGKTLGSRQLELAARQEGLPDRNRLCFRFASSPVKEIVYVWFNEEDTSRKAGSKSDVYETFKRLLARGSVPRRIDGLLREASD